jgi:hypothetical protein
MNRAEKKKLRPSAGTWIHGRQAKLFRLVVKALSERRTFFLFPHVVLFWAIQY